MPSLERCRWAGFPRDAIRGPCGTTRPSREAFSAKTVPFPEAYRHPLVWEVKGKVVVVAVVLVVVVVVVVVVLVVVVVVFCRDESSW